MREPSFMTSGIIRMTAVWVVWASLAFGMAGCGSSDSGTPQNQDAITNQGSSDQQSSEAEPSPKITAITPAGPTPNSFIELAGTSFGTGQFTTSRVIFIRQTGERIDAGSVVSSQDWSNTRIRILVPSILSNETVDVQVFLRGGVPAGGVESNLFSVAILAGASPTISSVQPQGATTGQQVTITGQNFGSAQTSASRVQFQGPGGTLIDAGTALLWTDSQIVVLLPTGTRSGPVIVTKGALQSQPSDQTTADDLVVQDKAAPVVLSTSPSNLSSAVDPRVVIQLVFSEAMGPGVTNPLNYLLTSTAGTVGFLSVTPVGPNTFRLVPASTLQGNSRWTLSLLSGSGDEVTDLAGNALLGITLSFVTADLPGVGDKVPPQLVSITPGDGSLNVDIETSLVLTFNEPVFLGQGAVRLTTTGGQVTGAFGINPSSGASTLFVVTPPKLIGGFDYFVTVTSSVVDQAGNPLAGKTIQFKTISVSGQPGSDVTPPVLVSSNPARNLETPVNPNTQILLVFSEQLASSASVASNYRLTTDGGSINPDSAVLAGASVILSFNSPLLVDTTYTLILLSGLADLAGNALVPADPISFRTLNIQGLPGDKTPPAATSINPSEGTVGVGVQSEVFITFSEGMSSSVLSASNYQLTTPGGAYPFTLTQVSSTAVRLSPQLPLLGATSYRLILTSGLADIQGNPLTPVGLSFETADVPGIPGSDVTPPQLLSSSPANGAGGVDPNVKLLLVFSEQLGSSGSVASNYRLTTAGGTTNPDSVSLSGNSVVLDFGSVGLLVATSYTLSLANLADRAGNPLTVVNSITFTTADIPGKPGDRTPPTVVGTVPQVGSIVGVSTDLFITFSEAMDPTALASAANYQLTTTGGIYPFTVTVLNSTSVQLTPTPKPLPANTTFSFAFSSGLRDLQGNPLIPQTGSFLTGDAVGVPGADLTPPTLLDSQPADGAGNVAPEVVITLTFSEGMDVSGSVPSNYRLTTSGGEIPVSTATLVGSRAVLTFAAPLPVNTAFRLQLTSNLKDRAGNALIPPPPIVFTTANIPGQPGDITPPTLLGSNPASGNADVAPETVILLEFSEGLSDTASLTSNYLLTTDGGAVTISSATVAGSQVVLSFPGPLPVNTTFRLQLTSSLKDKAGNALVPPSPITFTTANIPGQPGDTTPPILVASLPSSGTQDVDTKAFLVLVFSEPLGPSASSESNYELTSSGGPITVSTASLTTTIVILSFADPLPVATSFRLRVSSNVLDRAGNALIPPNPILFTTVDLPGQPGDTTPPQLLSSTPANGAVNVDPGTSISLRFSESLGTTAALTSSYDLQTTEGFGIPISAATVTSNQVVLSFAANLPVDTTFRLRLTSGVRDLVGNAILSPAPILFTTADIPGQPGDTTSPTLLSSSPSTNAVDVDPNTQIVLTFSENMGPSASVAANYRLTTVGGSLTPLASATLVGTQVVLTPTASLLVDTAYRLQLLSTILDQAGNALVPPQAILFTTSDLPGLPGDTTAPSVASINPADNTTAGVDSEIFITFSEPMGNSAFSIANYSLTTPGGTYPFDSVTANQLSKLSDSLVKIGPQRPLIGGITYTLSLSTEIADKQNNRLSAFTSTFKTPQIAGLPGSDLTPPRVLAANPADGASDVDPQTRILVTFSEPMDTATVTSASNYTISSSTASFNPSAVTQVTAPANSVDLTLPSVLVGSTQFTVVLSNRILDKAGNPLSPTAFRFTTANVVGTGTDTTAPKVSSTNPPNGSTSASLNTSITVTFSERVDTTTFTPPGLTVGTGLHSALNPLNYDFFSPSGNVGIFAVTALSFPPNSFVLSPATTQLRGGTIHTLVPSNRIRDLAGNGLESSAIFFTTVDQPGSGVGDVTAPELLSFSPPDSTAVLNNNTRILFTFSEPMAATALDDASYRILVGFGTVDDPTDVSPVTVFTIEQETVPANSFRFEFPLSDPELPALNRHYAIEFSNQLKDGAGNPLVPVTRRFTHGTPPVAGPQPNLVSTSVDSSPVAIDAFRNKNLVVTYDAPVAFNLIPTTDHVQITGQGTSLAGAGPEDLQVESVSLSSDGRVLSIKLRTATITNANLILVPDTGFSLSVLDLVAVGPAGTPPPATPAPDDVFKSFTSAAAAKPKVVSTSVPTSPVATTTFKGAFVFVNFDAPIEIDDSVLNHTNHILISGQGTDSSATGPEALRVEDGSLELVGGGTSLRFKLETSSIANADLLLTLDSTYTLQIFGVTAGGPVGTPDPDAFTLTFTSDDQ